ncbi:MAG: hypothetical protein DMG97_09770 [Acidobacteria bacterium]|nr:MAG: hypothetical protein DMG97_09770 [Acidobacteriota bacterium]
MGSVRLIWLRGWCIRDGQIRLIAQLTDGEDEAGHQRRAGGERKDGDNGVVNVRVGGNAVEVMR